jgi:hypothetical protein
MAFTRFHDDPARIEKALLERTYEGQYRLNTPGNKEAYVDDVHIRMQGWGANLRTNPFEINESLRRNRTLVKYDQSPQDAKSESKEYKEFQFGVDETRASLPAWTFRDKSQIRTDYLFTNPQSNLWFKFENNCPTRMLEKDHYQSAYYS